MHWVVENSKKVLEIVSDSDSERKIVFERRFRRISGSVQSLQRFTRRETADSNQHAPRAWPSAKNVKECRSMSLRPKIPPKPTPTV